MDNNVYVDWDKIKLLIRDLKIDLSDYGGSEINFLSKKTGRLILGQDTHWPR